MYYRIDAMITVYKYRVKSNERTLNRWSRAVNFVWNYCNDRQKDALRHNRKWLTGFDLNKLTSGSSKELDISSVTVQATCEQYARSRQQFKKPYLRYRGKRSLGWVAAKGQAVKLVGEKFKFHGTEFRVAYSRPIPDGAIIKDGTCFTQDSLGHWYISVVLDMPEKKLAPVNKSVGIDLGLKDFATLSNGEAIEAPKLYRKTEDALATAQRAGHIKQTKRIHAKIANQRKDFLHKLSRKIVNEFDVIAVGNVNASGLAKTKMSKSVLDAGWSSFRNMLRYKSEYAGRNYAEVNEAYTSRVCSSCGVIPETSPKGAKDLCVRQWICCECDAVHDRDVNGAKNILNKFRFPVERDRPVEGSLAL